MILFIICVCLMIEIVFDTGVEGHLTNVWPLPCQLSP